MTKITPYIIFRDLGAAVTVPIPVIDAAWSYAQRLKTQGGINWWFERVYVYVCLSLALKMHSDRDTINDILPAIVEYMEDIFFKDLTEMEIIVMKALDWNLSYEHPIPDPPPV